MWQESIQEGVKTSTLTFKVISGFKKILKLDI